MSREAEDNAPPNGGGRSRHEDRDGLREQPEPEAGGPPSERPRPRWLRIAITTTIATAVLFFFFRGGCGSGQPATGRPIPYTELRQQVREGNVEKVTFRGDQITGELRRPIDGDEAAPAPDAGTAGEASREARAEKQFHTVVPSIGDRDILALLEEHEVQVNVERASGDGWLLALTYMLPLLLILGLGWMFMSRMRTQGQNLLSIGASRARRYNRTDERTTFDDVAGLDGAKAELLEIIGFLKAPARFRALGATPPKGVLLVGPPGTGKTLLARATAGEAGVPFYSITGSDFMEMFVGVGASRVRGLFEEARRNAPAIVFIDELDSIGRRRGAGLGGGHDEREQTLNQLLSALDGFEPQEGVIVLAATNRPDILDPALQRPGRFDRHVLVDAPGVEARRKILEVHARNKPLSEDVDLRQVAAGTPGFSGAALRNLLNEAALLAGRKDKEQIEHADIEEARDKLLLGLEREGLGLTEAECRLSAYHEAGHAVVAAVRPLSDPVRKVSIVPRARSLGATETLPERDLYVYSREYIMDRLAVMMGGRAAERIVLDTTTSGAERDLKEATKLARTMVLDWGMGDRLGHVALGGESDEVFLGRDLTHSRAYSDATAREVDEEVRAVLEDAYGLAEHVVRENRDWLDRIAEQLIDKEELTGAEILELKGRPKSRRSAPDGDGARPPTPSPVN